MRLTAVTALLLVLTACGQVDAQLDDGPENDERGDYPTTSVTPSTVTETADPTESESTE